MLATALEATALPSNRHRGASAPTGTPYILPTGKLCHHHADASARRDRRPRPWSTRALADADIKVDKESPEFVAAFEICDAELAVDAAE